MMKIYDDSIRTVRQLSTHLAIDDNTVLGWRARGIGPVSHKFDHTVFYNVVDIKRFLDKIYVTHHPKAPSVELGRACLRTAEAAQFIGVTYKVMSDWRVRKVGPNYYKFGRVISYRPEDLEFFRTILDAGQGPRMYTPKEPQLSTGPDNLDLDLVPTPEEPCRLPSLPNASFDDDDLSLPLSPIESRPVTLRHEGSMTLKDLIKALQELESLLPAETIPQAEVEGWRADITSVTFEGGFGTNGPHVCVIMRTK